MSCSLKVASFVVETPGESIPVSAIRRAKQALVDFIGVAIAGSVEPVSRLIVHYTRKNKSLGEATVIGTDFKAGVAEAALANSTMGHALDYDDSNFVLGGHPSVTLFPAVLALGQKLGCTGQLLLEAYVIGFEVMIKMARNVNFEHYEKGWHPTATLGTFGAAAATARILGISLQETAMSLGLAASMASGIKENFGSMGKPLQVGHACHKGLLCSLLAAEGFTSSLAALEGKQGFYNVYNGVGRYRVDNIEEFGDPWEIVSPGIMFKKYACCGSTHPVIDAALDLMKHSLIPPDQIDSVLIRINPRRLPHVNRPVVTSPLEAKFSLQYTVAVALTDREVSLRHFTGDSVGRNDIQKLLSKTRVAALDHADDALSQACEIVVGLKDGSEKSIRLEEAHGRQAEDFASETGKKFMDCAQRVFQSDAACRLLEQLEHFDEVQDISSVMSMLNIC